MLARPRAVHTQNDWRPGMAWYSKDDYYLVRMILTVTAPTPKARTSVRLVTVMETPACCRVAPSKEGIGRRGSESFLLLRHCTITNMSSIPIPA